MERDVILGVWEKGRSTSLTMAENIGPEIHETEIVKCLHANFFVYGFLNLQYLRKESGCQKRQGFDFVVDLFGPHIQIRLKLFSLLRWMNTSVPVPETPRRDQAVE